MSRASSRLSFRLSGTSTVDDSVGQTFGNGGLADAGLADQDGVVLGPSRQNLHGPADFIVAPDHRIELAVARFRGSDRERNV